MQNQIEYVLPVESGGLCPEIDQVSQMKQLKKYDFRPKPLMVELTPAKAILRKVLSKLVRPSRYGRWRSTWPDLSSERATNQQVLCLTG